MIQHPKLVSSEEIDSMLLRCGLFTQEAMKKYHCQDAFFAHIRAQLPKGQENRRTGRTTLMLMECLVLCEKEHLVRIIVPFNSQIKEFRTLLDKYAEKADFKPSQCMFSISTKIPEGVVDEVVLYDHA